MLLYSSRNNAKYANNIKYAFAIDSCLFVRVAICRGL